MFLLKTAQENAMTLRSKELTPELIHEFIDRIVVYAPKYLEGKRYQVVDVYYSGVGILRELSPEEMEEAFQDNKNLTAIRLPDTVTEIGTCAFCRCSKLAEIQMPKNLERIGDHSVNLAEWVRFMITGNKY